MKSQEYFFSFSEGRIVQLLQFRNLIDPYHKTINIYLHQGLAVLETIKGLGEPGVGKARRKKETIPGANL